MSERLRHEGLQVGYRLNDDLLTGRRLMAAIGGRNKLAVAIGVIPSNLGRMLNGEKRLSDKMAKRLDALIGRLASRD